MKHYIRGHFTVTFARAHGVTPSVVTALLAQLKPGAVIDDMTPARPPPPHAAPHTPPDPPHHTNFFQAADGIRDSFR